MNTKHGFLTPYVDPSDGFVSDLSSTLYVAGEQPHDSVFRPFSPEGLIEFALLHHLTHLWVTPECGHDLTEQEARMKGECPGQEDYDFLSFTNKATGKLSSIVGRRKRCGRQPQTANVNIIYLSQSSWKYENIEQFQAFISEVETRLGVPMKGSPTSVGLRFLEKIDARYYQRYFADPEINKAAMRDIFREAAKPLIWCRMPTKDELTPRPELYIVAVDKRAAYPRAAQENVGIGPAIPYTGEFNHRLPGVWDVEVSGLDRIDSRMPALLWPGWEQGTLVTPIVRMLKDFGCTITVRDAQVWMKTAPVFDRWAKELWNHRLDVDGFKPIMNNTLGFTINGDDLEDEKFRPDWHAQFVGGLRALMLYNASKVAGEGGCYPFGCYIDALYYLTPYKNSVPGLYINPRSLGGYALKWCLPVTDEIRQIITDPGEQQHFNLMLNKLNTIAGAH